MRLNKKENIVLIIGILVVLAGIFVINNQPKETKELPRVKLKEPEKNKQFALMLEQENGEYQESSGELPTEGFKFNKEKSGCVDINGKVVEDALDYDYDTYTVLLDTSKTLYCYLYYDIDLKVYADLGGTNSYYKSTEYKSKIVSASFVDYVPDDLEGEEIVTYWDLTDTSLHNGYTTPSNSVIGWLEESGENQDQYNLYIGSKGSIYATSLSMAFNSMALKEINFDNLNTSETTNMSGMFSNCSNLVTLDLSTFDTSNVTDMSWMFYDLLVELPFKDWPKFVTTNVENMSSMFWNYGGNLDLRTFDTSKVTDMSNMFNNTNSNLPFEDWPDFVTTNVEDMSNMFWNYGGNLDLRTFDTSKVKKMFGMFEGFLGFSLDLSTFDTSQVTDMSNMFHECYNLESLDLSSFDTSQVTNMNQMFQELTIDLPFKDWPNFVTTNVEGMSYMFYGYQGAELDLRTFDTSKVTDMISMFEGCSSLTTLDLSNFTFDSLDEFCTFNTFYDVPSDCIVKIKRSQLGTFNDLFTYDFTLTPVD